MIDKYQKIIKQALSLVDGERNIIADIGAGAGTYHYILAEKYHNPKIYAVEPNKRLRDKIVSAIPIDGEFRDFKVPEKVDLICFFAAWHHCSDEDMPYLFENIKKISKPGTDLVVVNDFYVNWYWIFRKIVSCLRMGNIDFFVPIGGNHFRTKLQIKRIFRKYGYDIKFNNGTPNPFISHPCPQGSSIGVRMKKFIQDIDRYFGWKYYYSHMKCEINDGHEDIRMEYNPKKG